MLLIILIYFTTLQLPTSMQMVKKLMVEEYWLMWRGDEQSKDGDPGD